MTTRSTFCALATTLGLALVASPQPAAAATVSIDGSTDAVSG